ncbi:hypothetical protein SAMN05216203_1208 [Marinobacter daqiaonensis]|uniref:Uncharacterized protein n=1 Tax=Marinobacter daqiaonensis TaxID=650891 RepID=A0A1I6HG37_9GAMM|nr:hypothetical protein [Marinobacter daqiaonensis]SFR53381.1 hypothetical protein SAMN05216203_1208 [Marinobacter daqiaonensis]
MRMVLALILVVAALGAAVYAHLQLARQVPAPQRRWSGHVVLLAVAIAFGWVVSTVYMSAEEGAAVTVFLTAFGVTHMPPAIVLWLKRHQRRQQ